MQRDHYMQVVDVVSNVENLVEHIGETMLFAKEECRSGDYENTVLAHQMYHLLGILYESVLNVLVKLDDIGRMVVLLKQEQLGNNGIEMGTDT